MKEWSKGIAVGISASHEPLPMEALPDEDPRVPVCEPIGGWLEGGFANLDAAGCINGINESLNHWLDQSSEAFIGRRLGSMLGDHCGGWIQPLDALLRSTDTFDQIRLEHPACDSRPSRWFGLELVRHSNGSVVRLNSAVPPFADIEKSTWNEHLRPEAAQRDVFVRLLKPESQLKSLVDQRPSVIFSQEANFKFRFVSPKFEELTGIAIKEWKHKPQLFWHVIHDGDATDVLQQIKHARQLPEPIASSYRVRTVQTGRVSCVMAHQQAIVSRGGLVLGYEGVWLDVSRQAIPEKRLSSAVWKEALPILTMGLAHDFSNVTVGIHSLSETFLDQVEPRHEFNEGLSLIKSNSHQARYKLVHRIINLHQGRTGESYYYNFNELTTDAEDLLRKVLPRRMQFAVEPTSDALPVFVDVGELRQAVINLVLNAVDAMPQAGRLVLWISAYEDPPSLTRWQGLLPRRHAACLSIQDSGCGLKPHHSASIFEPFVTTKAMNKESGLDIYNAKLFVEKHRGATSVDSQEGVGTTFHRWLPQADFAEPEPAVRTTAQACTRRSLLLVGRSGETRDGTAEFLRVNGYQVVSNASPCAAGEDLHSRDRTFNTRIALAAPGDTALFQIVADVRCDHPRMRLILKIIGRNHDELSSDLPTQADITDMIILSDLSQTRILEKLAEQF